MFAIPWHDHTLVGTTDTPIETPSLEPLPLEQEIEFILSTAARYLEKAPSRNDVLSVFVGIRPLVRASDAENTASLSRDHTIHIDDSALLTIAGGKWTTYRHMAEDCVDQAATLARLPDKPCITKQLNVHGFHDNAGKFGDLWFYGSDALAIQNLAQTRARWAPGCIPICPISKPRLSGPCGKRWRERWKMFLPAAHGRCF